MTVRAVVTDPASIHRLLAALRRARDLPRYVGLLSNCQIGVSLSVASLVRTLAIAHQPHRH